MPSARRVVVALLAVALVAPAVAPALAAPPPEPLCGTCELDFHDRTSHDVRVDPAGSTVTVDLFENGSSRWTERVRLASGADELAANETLRAAVLDRAFHWHVADERLDTVARVEGETLVTTYRVPDVATRSLGVLTVDLFDRSERRSWVYAGAERATLLAPDGYRLVDGPSDDAGAPNDTAVVWSGGGGDSDYAPVVEGRVAFAPEDAALGGLRADAATALVHGPPLLSGAAAVALAPTLLVAAAVVLGVRSRARGGRGRSTPALAAAVVVAAVVGFVATGVALLFPVGPRDPGVVPRVGALLAVPTAALFALGYCASRGDGPRRFVGAVATVPWLVVVLVALNGELLAADAPTTALVAVGALAATLVGVPGFLLGRRLAPAASGRSPRR